MLTLKMCKNSCWCKNVQICLTFYIVMYHVLASPSSNSDWTRESDVYKAVLCPHCVLYSVFHNRSPPPPEFTGLSLLSDELCGPGLRR